MDSMRNGSRASRSRSAERSRSDRSHRDRHEDERESSRSRRRSRSHERSSGRSERRRRSPSRSRSPPRDASPSRRKDERRKSRSRSRDSKTRSRRRGRSASESSASSSSSDESSSSSSSSESESSSHRRSSSKHRRKRDAKKKKSKKTSKKDAKKKKKKTKKHKKTARAVDQNAYGKYGILRESDFHTKSQSFQAWLRDIKKASTITELNGPKWEAMELFKEYMEDYNTATLPHEKYYDIEKYDMRQYRKQQLKQSRGDGKGKGSGPLVVDEEALRREFHAQRLAREQNDFKLVLQTMDSEKIEAMRRQEQLRAQMQMHYKAGDVAEARRIEQLLRADEDAARKR